MKRDYVEDGAKVKGEALIADVEMMRILWEGIKERQMYVGL